MQKIPLNQLKQAIGTAIADARTKAGYRSANAFAVALKVDPGTVRNIERGTHAMTLATLHQVCQFLNIAPWELFHPNPAAVKDITLALEKHFDASKAPEPQPTRHPEKVRG